jgi:hypothetical protein
VSALVWRRGRSNDKKKRCALHLSRTGRLSTHAPVAFLAVASQDRSFPLPPGRGGGGRAGGGGEEGEEEGRHQKKKKSEEKQASARARAHA